VDQVIDLVLENRIITIHEVANMLGISFGSFQIKRKQPQKWNLGIGFSIMTTSFRSPLSVLEFMDKNIITVIQHPPYSPHYVLYDLFSQTSR
jgi:hypothetical protein